MNKNVLLVAGIAALTIMSASVAHAAGDAGEGKKVFTRVCGACHTDQANGPRKLGPTLFGVVGRKAGSVEGFRYSTANKDSGITWTPEVLDEYLKDPKAKVPGTIMAFAGLKNDTERQNVIAYLETLK
ncbi:MAG TPA: cytochrome c family protein [Alphaproteobacteria bacterium]|nr:cytochrome c family protein [Alphaproteobacteria bacterium]